MTYEPAEARTARRDRDRPTPQAFVVYAPDGAVRNIADLPEIQRLTIGTLNAHLCGTTTDADRGNYSPFAETPAGKRKLPRFLFVCINLPLGQPSLWGHSKFAVRSVPVRRTTHAARSWSRS